VDPDGSIVSQKWDLNNDRQFDDASGSSASTCFSLPGRYQVNLLVRDDNSDTDAVAHTVTVAPSANSCGGGGAPGGGGEGGGGGGAPGGGGAGGTTGGGAGG